jgi:hypothetical protein
LGAVGDDVVKGTVKDVMPILAGLVGHGDKKIGETAIECFLRIMQWGARGVGRIDALFDSSVGMLTSHG